MTERILLTPDEAAEALGIGVSTLRARTADGTFHAVYIGSLTRYLPDQLRACVASWEGVTEKYGSPCGAWGFWQRNGWW